MHTIIKDSEYVQSRPNQSFYIVWSIQKHQRSRAMPIERKKRPWQPVSVTPVKWESGRRNGVFCWWGLGWGTQQLCGLELSAYPWYHFLVSRDNADKRVTVFAADQHCAQLVLVFSSFLPAPDPRCHLSIPCRQVSLLSYVHLPSRSNNGM